MRFAVARPVVVALTLASFGAGTSAPLRAQDTTAKSDWEWFALPALNFNSDEGFGYGGLLELYNYRGGVRPYRFMIRPVVTLTTKGKRDFTIAFDAPGLLPKGWRLDAYLGREQHLATPWYGVGNNTVKDESLTDPPDAYYYRYGKTQYRAMANIQRRVSPTTRLLVGGSFTDVTTDDTPFDSGTTLLRQQLAASQGIANPFTPSGTVISVRAGFIIDTRDREVGPTSGDWIDLIVQHSGANGDVMAGSYQRATISARHYQSLTRRLVWAQRVVAQHANGEVPFFDLATIQNSSPTVQMEGLGGSSSMRGIEKNRFTARGIAFSNSELRYRFKELRVLGKDAYLVASGFFDVGRVWTDRPWSGDGGLHASGGAGFRVGLGPSFLVALDAGRSSESTQIYIGLGYPF